MFVLGGLRQKTVVESQRGIPYLKDIKHVGKFFRSHNTEVRESELIVFLRPEVITPYSCGSIRDQAAAASAGEQLDAIPYAESVPTSPYCQDHNCPNHHPRPRINGGAPSTETNHIVPLGHPVEIIDVPHANNTPGSTERTGSNERLGSDEHAAVKSSQDSVAGVGSTIRVVSDQAGNQREPSVTRKSNHTIVIDGGYHPPVYVDTRAINLGSNQ